MGRLGDIDTRRSRRGNDRYVMRAEKAESGSKPGTKTEARSLSLLPTRLSTCLTSQSTCQFLRVQSKSSKKVCTVSPEAFPQADVRMTFTSQALHPAPKRRPSQGTSWSYRCRRRFQRVGLSSLLEKSGANHGLTQLHWSTLLFLILRNETGSRCALVLFITCWLTLTMEISARPCHL